MLQNLLGADYELWGRFPTCPTVRCVLKLWGRLGTCPTASFALVSFFLCTGFAVAQTATPRTGSITGRIVADGGLLLGARVSLYAAEGNTSRTLTTDAEGNFAAHELEARSYRLTASLPGYVTANADEAQPLARIGDNVTLTLVKGGVITGRVTKPNGKPVVGIRVTATRTRDENGKASQSQRGMVLRQTVTDDRGEYRIFGLLAGSYVVMTSGNSYSMAFEGTPYLGDVPIFHPSNSRDTATEVKVQLGGETSGIDIRYRSTLGYTISGKVSGAVATGEGSGVSVSLNAVGGKEMIASTNVDTRREQTGFELVGVPAGEYELVAMSYDRINRGGLAAPRRVRVTNSSLSGLELALTPLASLSGQVVIEPAAARTREAQALCVTGRQKALSEIVLNLRPTAANDQPIFNSLTDNSYSITAEGAFKFTRVAGGTYRLLADLPGENWYVKSISANGAANGADLLALKAGENLSGVTVTLAEGAAQLSGKLEGSFSEPMRVHLVPVEAALANDVLRYVEAVVRADGTFALTHLAPGKYWLLALPADEAAKRPLAWDATARVALRKAAEAAQQMVELQLCMRISGYKLKQ